MVPVLVAVVLSEPGEWQTAAAIFLLASVSDVLDGTIARARKCVTAFGTLMDPVADKLLVGGALGALVLTDRAPLWLLLVVVAREVTVSGLRAVAARRDLIIPASPLGKAKMALQVATVVAIMAAGTAESSVQALMIITAGLTLASGVDYFLGYRHSRHVDGALATAGVPRAR